MARVSNRMSLRRDHDAYWANDEQFVLPVARLIEGAPGGAPTVTRFFARTFVSTVGRKTTMRLWRGRWRSCATSS